MEFRSGGDGGEDRAEANAEDTAEGAFGEFFVIGDREAGKGGSGDGDFHETGFYGEWHPQLCANFQTAENGLVDVHSRLVFSFALTDATGNGWALCDPDAVLIAVQCDDEFHAWKLASSE